ncbi:sensor histidine kinase [Streptomyces sp. NPDC056628]|uniref:sensor histidine kinase n=1 Tax=Streptomyces sp. NPDC056628 TaxID=3345882 RepID=UPI00368ED57B
MPLSLLDDARDRAQNASTAPGTTSVVPVLRRLVESLDTPEHVKIVVDVEDPGLQAGVASALLERIVNPLLTNSVRYAHSAMTVSTRRLPGSVRIDVTDDGPGVPAAFADDLFQPGRRADPSDGHDGAGLGLPLARRLARAVGGEVSHDRGHTCGARFRVDLPVE